jgi:outer membrane protein assembly factor BamB
VDAGGEGGVDAGVPVGASVLQFHNHINRDGFFVDSALTEAKAATFVRDTTFNGSIKSLDAGASGHVYASPLYVENGVSGKGTFYLATEDGTIFALDETTGAIVWATNVAPAPTQTGAGCGNINPIGVSGTPAIDLATRLIVFDSPTATGGAIKAHTIWALSIDTGKVAWSVDVSTLKDSRGTTFNPQPQNERGAVLILNGVAYVPFGGHYGDCGTYHGWVVGVPLSGTGAKAWATQVQRAGIWGPGGPASDGVSIFVTTGNGIGGASWAESEGLFRLSPGLTDVDAGVDYFAPYNWQSLDNGDVDLSGSGPLVIDAPSMTPSELVMAQGKDGYLYLMDRSNLGGIATSAKLANIGALQVQSGEITNAGAWATVGGTTYVVVRPNGTDAAVGCPAGTSGDLIAVKLDKTAPQKMTPVWCANSNGIGSPSITTSNGTADPMVWVFGAEQGANGKLYSFDLVTGKAVFTGGAAADTGPNVRRFTTPIAVHGRVFVGGDNQLYAYKAK